MKLKGYTKEDLESMSYTELAEIILNEKGSSMKIVDVFKKICKLLEMSDAEFEAKVADFFELISTDKNFIVLEKGFCDLRKKHTPKVVIEEDDEEVIEPEAVDEEETEPEEDSEEDIFYDNSSDKDDVEDSDDELSDFIVVDEEEEVNL
ncbi:MAG: DNA-directed RNA polymerase subunit delta [Bacilli bacterium]|nr:DNA-directed RNA polymerase subunit delta [Bacilli bacterium]